MRQFSGLLILAALLMANAARSQTTLDYFLQAARENSPLIKDNRNQAQASRLELDRIRAQYFRPQLGVSATYMMSPVLVQDNGRNALQLNPQSPAKYIGQDLGLTNGALYQGLVAVNQPLFMQSRYQVYSDETRTLTAVNENNIRITGFDLDKVVTDQYILCLADLQQLAFLDKYLGLLAAQRALVEKLAAASVFRLSDLRLLDIEIRTQAIAKQGAEGSYRRNLADLNTLAGVQDTGYHRLEETGIDLAENNGQSAFTEKFSLDSALLGMQQKVFELRYKPQWNLFANGGLNAANIDLVQRRWGFAGGISFTRILFDGRQKAIAQHRTRVLQSTAAAYRDNFLRQNAVRKAGLLQQLRSVEERLALTGSQVEAYQQLLENYRQELAGGQLSVINYVNTVKNAIGLERELSALRINRLLLINTYNYWNH